MDKRQIEERIKDLTDRQNKILATIKNKDCTVNDIIGYSKVLQELSIRISEIHWMRLTPSRIQNEHLSCECGCLQCHNTE